MMTNRVLTFFIASESSCSRVVVSLSLRGHLEEIPFYRK